MGYAAHGGFTITFFDEEDVKVCAYSIARNADPYDLLTRMIEDIGEYTDAYWHDDNVTVSGSFGGKYYDSELTYLLDQLAGFATAVFDFIGEDDSIWRCRLRRDGTYKEYGGEVVYPDDPGPDLTTT